MEHRRRRHNLCEQVVLDLGRRIVRGDFQPGAVLPQEAALCDELEVSRTVVREAVKVLAAKGLVETRSKRGTVVRPSRSWSHLDPEVLQWRIEFDADGSQLMYLTELRQAVEPAAAAMAAMAAVRASDEEISLIAEACQAMSDSIDSVEAFAAADRQFHIQVLHASGNPFLAPIAHVVSSVLLSSLRVTNRKPEENATSVPLQQRVWKAIQAREPAKAEAAMKTLLRDAAARIEQNVRPGKKRPAK